MKYPRKLSSGANNTVIVLSDTEVAKLFTGDTRSDIGSEAEKMKFANTVNDLIVKFIRLDYNEDLQAEMLVMERLLPWTTAPTKWKCANYGLMCLRMNSALCIKRALYTET
ncbi:hypothetical protein [Runella sp. CRIBMP]|uniref:hypothetical protein n=1 Tax=Runella sp. CRIBMP TaxID=2683261 RepID=UPI001E5B325C|nr:hypothetical protein [Runella sp. CRIBMP]